MKLSGKKAGCFLMAMALTSLAMAQKPKEEPFGGNLKITSPAFGSKRMIPSQYTCEGENINPPLKIEGLPTQTQNLALILDDPDAPGGTFTHWTVFNIPVTSEIGEKTIPGQQGKNDFGKLIYGGPCPPAGTHRYFFKIYALDHELDLQEGVSRTDLEKAMEAHVLDKGALIGLYKRTGIKKKK